MTRFGKPLGLVTLVSDNGLVKGADGDPARPHLRVRHRRPPALPISHRGSGTETGAAWSTAGHLAPTAGR